MATLSPVNVVPSTTLPLVGLWIDANHELNRSSTSIHLTQMEAAELVQKLLAAVRIK